MAKFNIELVEKGFSVFKSQMQKYKNEVSGLKNMTTPFKKALNEVKKLMIVFSGMRSKFSAAIQKTIGGIQLEITWVKRLSLQYDLLMAKRRMVAGSRIFGMVDRDTPRSQTVGTGQGKVLRAGHSFASSKDEMIKGLTLMNEESKATVKSLEKQTAAAYRTANASNESANAFNNQGKAMKKVGQQTSLLNTKFGSFAIIMSGLAATIFVFQNIVRAIKSVASVGIDFEHVSHRMAYSFRLTGIELVNFQNIAQETARKGVMSTTEAMKKMNEMMRDGATASEAMSRFKAQMLWEAGAMGETKRNLNITINLLKEFAYLSFDAVDESFNGWLERMNERLKAIADGSGPGFVSHLKDVGFWMAKNTGIIGIYVKQIKKMWHGYIDVLQDITSQWPSTSKEFLGIRGFKDIPGLDLLKNLEDRPTGGLSPEEQRQKREGATKARIKAIETMYSSLKFHSETYYTWQREQIEQEAEQFARVSGNKILAKEYENQRMKELEEQKRQFMREMWEQSGTAIGGIKLGLDDVLMEWTDVTQITRDLVVKNFNLMGDAVADFATGAKQDWGQMAESMIKDIAKIIIKMLIMLAIQKALESAGYSFGGKGMVVGGTGGITETDLSDRLGRAYGPKGAYPFGLGGMINSKKYFRFAGGIGVAGEAGTEAILPLKRDSQGRLGVTSMSMTPQTIVPPVVVNIYNNTDKETEAKTESEFNGQEYVVNVWLDAYARDAHGLRSTLGHR